MENLCFCPLAPYVRKRVGTNSDTVLQADTDVNVNELYKEARNLSRKVDAFTMYNLSKMLM